jgi:hypothetical protein
MDVLWSETEEFYERLVYSYLRTLGTFQRASMKAHGHVTLSVIEYAALRNEFVQAIAKEFPENKRIQNWSTKFGETYKALQVVSD